jgi:hypothetical protein
MNVNESNRRLAKLSKFLCTKVPKDRFDYGHWVGAHWKGKADLSCGTSACAAGWATTIPEFRRRGLNLVHDANQMHDDYGGHVVFYDGYVYRSGISAVARFFGLDFEDARMLFAPHYGEPTHSAEFVADKIDHFIESRKERIAVFHVFYR